MWSGIGKGWVGNKLLRHKSSEPLIFKVRASLPFVPANQHLVAGSTCARAFGEWKGLIECIFRHDYAALAPGGRAGLNAKVVP
jgi:hypothetical protein